MHVHMHYIAKFITCCLSFGLLRSVVMHKCMKDKICTYSKWTLNKHDQLSSFSVRADSEHFDGIILNVENFKLGCINCCNVFFHIKYMKILTFVSFILNPALNTRISRMISYGIKYLQKVFIGEILLTTLFLCANWYA